MEKAQYTAGELARIAGVSLRTIRFYDEKGLLKPVSYSNAGYRCYNQESLAVLQRILMLKYLGFSLDKIDELLTGQDMELQFSQQKKLLLQKKTHLEEIISVIERLENSRSEDKWNYLVRLLNLTTEEEKVKEQYLTSDNLEKRIRIHDYSTNPQSWMEWIFEKLELRENQKVLELGCGTGLLWQTNIHRLPRGLYLLLTDRSEGMLEKTRQTLSGYKELLREREIHIEFRIVDGNEFSYENSYEKDCFQKNCGEKAPLKERLFDCIIANHMLYHVKRREACLREIAKGLKPEGTFYCSTVGDTHMKELHELVAAFDTRIEMPFSGITAGFRLENAVPQLAPFFSWVERMDQENDLIVDDAEAIYEYVKSYPGNASCILEHRGQEFRRMLRKRIEEEGAIYIHKSTGMFRCRI